MLYLIKCCFHIYWYDHVIFVFPFMWCIRFIDLQILYYPCIPGMNPTWSWSMIISMYCWMWFANILLRILVSMFISDIEHLFVCLLATCMSSLEKFLFRPFAHFLIGFFCLFFGVEFCKHFINFCILTPYQMYWWICSPFCTLSWSGIYSRNARLAHS